VGIFNRRLKRRIEALEQRNHELSTDLITARVYLDEMQNTSRKYADTLKKMDFYIRAEKTIDQVRNALVMFEMGKGKLSATETLHILSMSLRELKKDIFEIGNTEARRVLEVAVRQYIETYQSLNREYKAGSWSGAA